MWGVSPANNIGSSPPPARSQSAPRYRPANPERGGFSIINLEARVDFIACYAGAGFAAACGLP